MNTEQMLEIINTLANKLGTTADHVYGVLVTQTILQGIYFLIAAIIMTITCYYGTKILRIGIKSHDEDRIFAGSFMIIVAGAISMLCCFSAITNLFNPEYEVIDYLIRIIK